MAAVVSVAEVKHARHYVDDFHGFYHKLMHLVKVRYAKKFIFQSFPFIAPFHKEGC